MLHSGQDMLPFQLIKLKEAEARKFSHNHVQTETTSRCSPGQWFDVYNMQLAILVIVFNVTFKAFRLFNFQWSILSRHGSKSCNLSGFKCGTDFLCPWHGKLSWGNENIPSSIVIFHKYVLFCPLGNISKQSILKEIKPIHNLLIFSFLSLESLWLLTKILFESNL